MEHLVTTSVRTATPDRFGSTDTTATGLLLTSHGVHRTLSHERMTDLLRHAPNPAKALIGAVAGARDNTTAVVLTPAAAPVTPPMTLPVPAV
jgi:protein phosphatase